MSQDSNVLARRLSARVRAVRSTWPSIALLTILGIVIALPVAFVVVTSLSSAPPTGGIKSFSLDLSSYAELASSTNGKALVNSLIIGAGGTALALFIGCTLALLAVRTNVPFKPVVQVAGIIPLFTESLIGALAWSILASPRRGYINVLLETLGISWRANVYSLPGIIFVMGLYYAPYVFLFVSTALATVDPQLEESARSSGASIASTIRTITLPLAAPAVLGSGLLTFILIIENFSVPALLGAQSRIDTIPTRIYDHMTAIPSRPNAAAAIGMVLMVLMVTILAMQRRYTSKRRYTTITGKEFRPSVVDLGPWRWLGFAFVLLYLLLAVVMPYYALVQAGFRPYYYIASVGDFLTTDGYTLSQFRSLMDDEVFVRSVRNSLTVGTFTAIVGTVFVFALAYAVYRTSLQGRRTIEFMTMAPLSVPAMLMGMGIAWLWLELPLPLYGTLAILVLAYIARFAPEGFRSAASSIQAVHRDIEDSAVLSGASRLRAATEITFRLIRPGIIATALLLMLLAMRELSASLFLFTSDTVVLSIQVFNTWDSGRVDRAAAMSIIYSLILLIVTVIVRRGLDGRPVLRKSTIRRAQMSSKYPDSPVAT